MPLSTGRSLSFYEILGPRGAGGMGEVYRARDTRLEREVAIKVLPEELADDDDRLRRFEREAKTLASLNHTNIAGVYGIDQVDDTCDRHLGRRAAPLRDRLLRALDVMWASCSSCPPRTDVCSALAAVAVSVPVPLVLEP